MSLHHRDLHGGMCKLIIIHCCVQALLDVYTIQREVGRLENIRIGLVGDLANGRTVRSLAYLLSMYPGMTFDVSLS